jgi:cytochrome c oxidase cbb3-type subunit 3
MLGQRRSYTLPIAVATMVAMMVATPCAVRAQEHDAPGQPLPPATKAMEIPLGDVLDAPHLRAELAIKGGNPFEGQAAAVQDGKVLYQKMNCAYCHQFGGTGLIGPSLANGQWRYGGRPGEIFQSIFAGRPRGMPAWGDEMPAVKIWQIVSYIESLGGTVPPGVARQGDMPAKPTPAVGLDEGMAAQ